MCKLITDLPREVAGRILSVFLEIKAVGQLDRATCSHSDRGNLMNLLSSSEVSFLLDCDRVNNPKRCIRWCIRRQIKLHSFLSYRLRIHLLVSQLIPLFQNSAVCLRTVCSTAPVIFSALQLITGKYATLSHMRLDTAISLWSFANLLAKVKDSLQSLYTYGVADQLGAGQPLFTVLCPKVKTVELEGPVEISNIVGIDRCFPNLRELVLNRVKWGSDVVFQSNFPQLRKLSLQDNRDVTDHMCAQEGTVSDDLCALFSCCVALREVHMETTDGVDDNVLQCLALSCPQLTTLAISACTDSGVTPSGILALAEHATNLTSLKVVDNYQTTMISSLAIAAMKKFYPKLSIKREEI